VPSYAPPPGDIDQYHLGEEFLKGNKEEISTEKKKEEILM
jgi:hypothetical protein